MKKITLSFRRMGFVVHVRRFGEMKIMFKMFSENLKAIVIGRLQD